GTGASSYTLTSLGQAPVIDLGDLGTGQLTDTNSLLGGEIRSYRFSVPAGVQTVLTTLLGVPGNPTTLRKLGTNVPNHGASSGHTDTYGNEGGESKWMESTGDC